MVNKEELIASLMERLNDPVLTRPEFEDIKARIEAVQQMSE